MNILNAVKSGIVSGTTASGYVEAVRVDTRGCGPQGKFLALIANLDSSASMYYKIDGYPADPTGALSGKAVAIKAETSIAASTTITQTDADKNYAAIVISVKQNSGAGNYQIDYTTY